MLHIFVTYNSTSSAETKLTDITFINQFVSFTLPQINSTSEYDKQIILRSLLQSSYLVDFTTNIGAQFGNIHNATNSKQKSIIDGDPFAGSIALTGQSLKFITEEFKLFVKHLNQINEKQKNEI